MPLSSLAMTTLSNLSYEQSYSTRCIEFLWKQLIPLKEGECKTTFFSENAVILANVGK